MLETMDIKAPTLYKTDNESAKKLQAKVEGLIKERDNLEQKQADNAERLKHIPHELYKHKHALSKTLDKDARKVLKEAIKKLEAEKEEAQEVLEFDIKEVMRDKVAASGVQELQEKANEEHSRWLVEAKEYNDKITSALKESREQVRNIIDRNIYKASAEKLGNLERYLSK